MQISKADWLAYIEKLSKLNKEASDLIVQYVQENGFSNRKELIDYAYAVANKYGDSSAALATIMYDAIADASGVYVEPAEMPDLISEDEVAKTVNGTLKRSKNVKELGGAVSRLVKRQSADTMLHNAYRDRKAGKKYGKKRNTGAQVAWVPHGDTCPFCLMLASNGWRNQTVGGAKDHAEHIHANCDCNYAVRFDDRSGVEGYNPDTYAEMFENVEGDTWEEKVNSMRRQQYEQNKDEINAQKRAAYALRVENNDVIETQKHDTHTDRKIKEEIKRIESTPFIVREGVGAMARRFYIEKEIPIKDFDDIYIKPETYVEGVKVISYGNKIREVQRLIEEYKLPNGNLTKPEDWYKVRGSAVLTDGTNDLGKREIHWYQAKNVGKVEFKFPSNPRQR